jgi:hypothetical protein
MVRVTQIYEVRLFLDEVRKTSSCANQKPAEKVPARRKVLGLRVSSKAERSWRGP